MITETGIALYAAVVSTVVLMWEIYKAYIDRKSKLLIDGGFRSQAVVYHNRTIGAFEDYFGITITNVGNHKRLIEKPKIQTYEKISDGDFFCLIDLEDRNNYPFPIEPGEQFSYTIHAESINDSFKRKGVSKIRVLVFDTHRKEYKSRWYKI